MAIISGQGPCAKATAPMINARRRGAEYRDVPALAGRQRVAGSMGSATIDC